MPLGVMTGASVPRSSPRLLPLELEGQQSGKGKVTLGGSAHTWGYILCIQGWKHNDFKTDNQLGTDYI